LFFAIFSLWTIVMSVALLVAGPFFPTGRACGVVGGIWGRGSLCLLGTICGLRHRARNWDQMPDNSAILLVKHQSAWETVALRGLLPPCQAWVLKEELKKVPFFGWALSLCQPIAINRRAGRRAIRQMVEQGTSALQSGRLVIVFPEGTRTAPGEQKRYGLGGAILAEKSGYPVVPVAHNAGVFWRRRGVRKFPGTIDLVVGPAIETRGKTAQEIIGAVEDWIETTVAQLPSELQEAGES
jgi:1-acyl-sn-glycerol-3-phosphate acyltransferase